MPIQTSIARLCRNLWRKKRLRIAVMLMLLMVGMSLGGGSKFIEGNLLMTARTRAMARRAARLRTRLKRTTLSAINPRTIMGPLLSFVDHEAAPEQAIPAFGKAVFPVD